MFVKKVYKKLITFCEDKWRSLTGNKNLVFEFDSVLEKPVLPHELQVERYERFDEVPSHALQTMYEESGKDTKLVDAWLQDEFNNQGVLWLGFIGDELVVRQWIRYGKHFDEWFIKLDDFDFVFFAAGTFLKWRGMGLSPVLKKVILHFEGKKGGKAFVDVRPSNTSAIRALHKNKVKCLGKMRHYKK